MSARLTTVLMTAACAVLIALDAALLLGMRL